MGYFMKLGSLCGISLLDAHQVVQLGRQSLPLRGKDSSLSSRFTPIKLTEKVGFKIRGEFEVNAMLHFTSQLKELGQLSGF